MSTYIKTTVLIIALLLFVTFGVKNSQPIQLTYYFNLLNVTIPLYAVMYALLLVGLFIGMMIGLRSRLKFRKKIKDLEKDISGLKEKIIESKEAWQEGIKENP